LYREKKRKSSVPRRPDKKGHRVILQRDRSEAGRTGLYPESLDELIKSRYSIAPKRSLRRLYKDPVTGKPDWIIVTDPLTKGLLGYAVQAMKTSKGFQLSLDL
jgi:hypothetical protein